MTDGASAEFISYMSGSDPADPVDRAIRRLGPQFSLSMA